MRRLALLLLALSACATPAAPAEPALPISPAGRAPDLPAAPPPRVPSEARDAGGPDATATSAPPTPAPPTSAPPTPAPRRFRIVVSFGSECCGIDRRAADALDAVASRYAGRDLGRTRAHWGREGERDECFALTGLPQSEAARFVREVRATVRGKLVSVREEADCHPDRDALLP